jgi:small subunit ribosomal protein S3
MGQKVNPFGFRLGPLYTWKSRWYADSKDYVGQVLEDYKVRQFLRQKLVGAGLSQVEIERSINIMKIILFVSRPGVVIGRGGANLEQLKTDLLKLLKINPDSPKTRKLELKVEEIKNPDLQAILVLERIKDQLSKRYPHRRAVSQAIEKVMGAGAQGVKIVLSGRIGGAEIGRQEKYYKGRIPSQTLRVDIHYAEGPAYTRSGYVGIKVYIYRGERATN